MNTLVDSTDVEYLLKLLNLYDNRAADPYFNRNVLNDYYSRKRHYTSVNVANLDVTFGQVLQLIQRHFAGGALRTGHTTDWTAIDANNTGLLDYNNTVTRNNKYGILMLHDQTETDNAGLSSGDTIYLPSSEVLDGQRFQRDLFFVSKGKLLPCDKNISYFLPACYIQEKGEYIQLIRHLKAINRSLPNLQYDYESDAVHRRLDAFKQYIGFFLDLIATTKDEWLTDNFFRKLVKDGVTIDTHLKYFNNQFVLHNIPYTKEELLDLIVHPFKLAAFDDTTEPLTTNRDEYPLLHNSLLILFMALQYNYPMLHEAKRPVFNTHFHWGAIGMAGYPPDKKGYFRTATKTVKRFHAYLSEKQQAPNLFFVLIPIFPFLFYADPRDGNDLRVLSALFEKIHRIPIGNELETDTLIRQQTTEWINAHWESLTPYFQNKFRKQRTILFHSPLENRQPACPDYLLDTPYRHIAVVVSTLFNYYDNLS